MKRSLKNILWPFGDLLKNINREEIITGNSINQILIITRILTNNY